jgi:hypothetical protein
VNTLAQSRTEKAKSFNGNGTELKNNQAINRRVKRKTIIKQMTLGLIGVVI